MKYPELYLQTVVYAMEHGERKRYVASWKENVACKQGIEQALARHYGDDRLNSVTAAVEVIRDFGMERVKHVLANTIRYSSDWDPRISQANREWACTVLTNDDGIFYLPEPDVGYVVNSHPGLIDLLVSEVRHQELLRQPLTDADIEKEAAALLADLRKPTMPNSPDGKHYIAQISHDFMMRANSRNLDRLFARLPFGSLCFTTLNGRDGRFAVIGQDEDRNKPLRKPRRSVRDKLAQAPAPLPAEPKRHEQER